MDIGRMLRQGIAVLLGLPIAGLVLMNLDVGSPELGPAVFALGVVLGGPMVGTALVLGVLRANR